MERLFNLVKFPIETYPVMYRAFYIPYTSQYNQGMLEANRIAYVTGGDQLQALTTVYHNYYDLLLNPSTLTQVSYEYDVTPYTVVFIVVYLVNNIENYIWEYLPIWANIKKLNHNNKII